MDFRRKALRVLLALHRVLGTLFSLVLLMCFLSGMVMIYHDLPRVGDKALPYLPSLPTTAADSLHLLRGDSVHALTLTSHHGKPVYRIGGHGREHLDVGVYTAQPVGGAITLEQARALAYTWSDTIIEEKEINRLESFIPLSSYEKHFPIYRFKLGDADRTTLYVSSVTGEIVQATTASERFWSWLGPIPHYIYFWQLRQHREAWIDVVTWVGAFGAVICLSGVIIGIVMCVKVWRRKRQLRSPYRKPLHLKWHHILGLFFGFFMFTFALSGVYSLHPLPQWLVGSSDDDFAHALMQQEPLHVSDTLRSDLRAILATDSVKTIEVKSFGDDTYYRVAYSGGYKYLDVVNGQVVEHCLTARQVEAFVAARVPASYSIKLLDRYDSNYSSGKRRVAELPVYRIKVDDPDQNIIYIAPVSGNMRVVSKASRTESWLYPKMHSFRFGALVNYPILRQVIIWILLLGGATVSFTGVLLGIRYINRIFRRKNKHS